MKIKEPLNESFSQPESPPRLHFLFKSTSGQFWRSYPFSISSMSLPPHHSPFCCSIVLRHRDVASSAYIFLVWSKPCFLPIGSPSSQLYAKPGKWPLHGQVSKLSISTFIKGCHSNPTPPFLAGLNLRIFALKSKEYLHLRNFKRL